MSLEKLDHIVSGALYDFAALASQQKPAPVLLTDEEIYVVVDRYKFHDPKVRQSHIARAIESAVHRKNNIGG